MAETEGEALLAELRTLVTRARDEAESVRRGAEIQRDALRGELEQARAEREEAQRAFRDAHRNGQLDPDARALARRLEDGETSWEAVAHGQDDHWTARVRRERVIGEVTEAVETMTLLDPEFAADLERVRERDRG
jgi:uncharacterized protein (DUF3084 family)